MNNISQRDAFFDVIYNYARDDCNIVIVSADMSAPSLDIFRRNLPNQFINVGIAEQNAILVASGLASEGKKVFVYAIASFITLRCLEQIRVQSAINEIPITIVGMGVGLGYCSDGPTHHLIEDIAVMRAFPNIEIINVTDAFMGREYAQIICTNQTGTTYIRLDKDISSNIYSSFSDYRGTLSLIRGGNEYIIITTGIMVHVAIEVLKELKREDIGLIDVFKYPIVSEFILEQLKNSKKVLTLEEHFLAGGLGSAINEIIMDAGLNISVKRLGLDSSKGYSPCYKYGGREIIRKTFGLGKDHIKKVINEYFSD